MVHVHKPHPATCAHPKRDVKLQSIWPIVKLLKIHTSSNFTFKDAKLSLHVREQNQKWFMMLLDHLATFPIPLDCHAWIH